MAKKVTPGYRERLAKARAAAGLAPLAEPSGKRMMIEFGGGAPDQRIADARNRMDPDYEGQFSQEPGAYAKPTRIEIKGEAARDYSNELGTRQQVREIASDTWKRTPLPVLDARDLNDEKLIAENDRAKRYGLSVSPLDNKIAAVARARRDPRAVQQALENLKTENVVTGGPGLDPGETMPADAYLRMRQREHAADRADKTGQVQYLGHGPGNIAEWMSPGKPIPTEIMGVGGKSVLVNLRQADKAAYDAAMAPLDIEMKRIAQGLPGPNRSPDQIRADMQKVAEATIAKARMAELPIPASDMSSGAGIPKRDQGKQETDAGDFVSELQYTPQQMKERRKLEEDMATVMGRDYLTPSQKSNALAQINAKMDSIQPIKRLRKKSKLGGYEEGDEKSMGGFYYQLQREPRTGQLAWKKIGEDRSQLTHGDRSKFWDMALKSATVIDKDGISSIDMNKARDYYREFSSAGGQESPNTLLEPTDSGTRGPGLWDPRVIPRGGPAPAPDQWDVPQPLPPDRKQWRNRQVYINSKGASGRWNGKGFEVVK